MKPSLTLMYVHGDSIGYGRLGVELSKALTARNVEVYDDFPDPDNRVFLDGRRAKDTNVVCWVSVPTHAQGWYETQHTAMFTMWEAAILPESFRETLHEFNTVIVPSEHNVELFSKFHDNVHYVPLGIDPIRWDYQPRTPPGTTFDFLIGGSGSRKGTDLAARAFKKLWGKEGSWGDGPVPHLIMKSPKGDSGTDDEPMLFVHPRIKVLSGKLTNDEEVDLYASAHCYLQPSRGEGFGLQPLQAIAQGVPTILTAAHGHASFAHLGYGLSTKPATAAYFIYGDAGEWWEPSLDELIEHMAYVYNHYDEACAKAQMASRVALRDFTWASTAAKFCRAFGDELTKPFVPGGWHKAQPKLFPVVTNQDWYCEIADRPRFFNRGETYYEMADVKRILFEAGLLDPVCILPDDTGLTQSQVARAALYRAEHSHCPTCHQPLNTAETKADAIFAELNA